MRIYEKRSTSPLAIGACITAIVTMAGATYALTHPRQDSSTSLASNAWQPLKEHCKTTVFDPQPPLNVRSTPIEQKGNIVGGIANGTELTILHEQNGWYRISEPTAGWVYKNLTKTECGTAQQGAVPNTPPVESRAASSGSSADDGKRLLEKAAAQYQAGNLKDAIALAKAVSSESEAYAQAQIALRTMPVKWEQAKSKYSIARQALRESRWNDVLKVAVEYPDIRFWRQKLAPLVKKATLMQNLFKADDSDL